MTTFITILFIIVLLGGTVAALTFFVWGVKTLKDTLKTKNRLASLLIISAFLIILPITLFVLAGMAIQIFGWRG